MLELAIMLAVIFIYAFNAWLYYSPTLVTTNWVWLGVGATALADAVWVILARNTHSQETLVFLSLCVGLSIDVAAVAVPVVAYGLRPSLLFYLGLTTALTGMGIIKYATLS